MSLDNLDLVTNVGSEATGSEQLQSFYRGAADTICQIA